MERWGLGYEDLKQVKPDIIMVRTSIHGQDGPYARQPLVGIFFQGAIGFHNLVGWPDRDPAGLPTAYTDYVAPWFVATGVLAGLDRRRRTGLGVEIDVNQIETGPHFLMPAVLDYVANGRVAERNGNRSRYASPNGVYPCRGDDRWCALSVATDEQWRALCRVLGRPELGHHPDYASAAARALRADQLDDLIARWTSDQTPEEVMALLQQAGVPAAVVSSGEDIMELDPHLKAREAFRTVHHPEVGDYRIADVPFKLSKGSSQVRTAPLLGQDTEYVCCELLGLSDSDFSALVAEGVLK
jgi:benzylsuccinate CoA-transferase BbsF subunit